MGEIEKVEALILTGKTKEAKEILHEILKNQESGAIGKAVNLLSEVKNNER